MNNITLKEAKRKWNKGERYILITHEYANNETVFYKSSPLKERFIRCKVYINGYDLNEGYHDVTLNSYLILEFIGKREVIIKTEYESKEDPRVMEIYVDSEKIGCARSADKSEPIKLILQHLGISSYVEFKDYTDKQ